MKNKLPDWALRAIASCEEQYPYLSAALDRMPVVIKDGNFLAACSKRGVIYLSTGVNKLNRDAAGGLLAHEIWHWLDEHFNRIGDRDPYAWNIATDASINDDLYVLPPGGIYPTNLGENDGLTPEVYYQWSINGAVGCVVATSGSASDGVDREWESSEDAGIDPSDKETADLIRDEVASAVKGYSIKGGADEWATRRLRTALPPLSVRLRGAIRRSGATPIDHEATYARPARVPRPPLIVPGREKDTGSVAVLLDVSGSMVKSLPRLLGILSSASDRYGEVHWYTGDVELTEHGVRKPSKFTGGGGTDMVRCLRQIDEMGHNLIVSVTDGICDWSGIHPRSVSTPCVVVLTGNETPEIPFPSVVVRGSGL